MILYNDDQFMDTLQAQIQEIFSVLKKTPAGIALRKTVRYSPYQQAHENIAYWKKFLGPSATVFNHMQFVYKVADSFLRYELKYRPGLFSAKAQRMILLAAAIHDLGEAKIDADDLGDIPHFLKNEEHERREAQVFEKVLSSLKLDPSLKKEMKDSYYKVVVNKDNKLYNFFRAVEDAEYIMTALNVYGHRKKKPLRIVEEKILIGSVLSIAVVDVVRVAPSYLSVANFLKLRGAEITLMFDHSKEAFQRSKNFSMKSKTASIEEAWSVWQKFLRH